MTSDVDTKLPSKRVVDLDLLRGASALAVLVLHASAEPLIEEAAEGRASWVFLLPNVIARFAVPVFMILSGMGLTLSSHRDESYGRFLWRRVASVVPAYVVWTLIYTWLMPKPERSVATLLTDLLTGHACKHLYFVPALLRLYVLFPVLSFFARDLWGVAGSCILSWSMIWLSPALTSTTLGVVVDEALPLRWIGYFVLGIWLGRARQARSDREPHAPATGAAAMPASAPAVGNRALRAHKADSQVACRLARARAAAPVIAIVLLVAMIAIVRVVVAESADIEVALGAAEPLIFPYSVSVLLWVSALTFGTGPLERALTFVSDRSYDVYLSHMLVLHLCMLILQTFTPESTHLMQFAIGVLLGTPMALAIAMLSDAARSGWKRPARGRERA